MFLFEKQPSFFIISVAQQKQVIFTLTSYSQFKYLLFFLKKQPSFFVISEAQQIPDREEAGWGDQRGREVSEGRYAKADPAREGGGGQQVISVIRFGDF